MRKTIIQLVIIIKAVTVNNKFVFIKFGMSYWGACFQIQGNPVSANGKLVSVIWFAHTWFIFVKAKKRKRRSTVINKGG